MYTTGHKAYQPQNRPNQHRLRAVHLLRQITIDDKLTDMYSVWLENVIFESRGVEFMQKHLVLFVYAIVMLSAVCAGAAETKDIRFSFKNSDPVVFSHELHLDKYNNNCKICHNAIFNLKERHHFTMAEM